ncbi:MAG: GGDEF domain-containing protein [Vulcanimicrobiaceae bacterium]
MAAVSIFGTAIALAFALAYLFSARRIGRAAIRLRLAEGRADELHAAARAFIAGSRESPAAVRSAIDAGVRRLDPAIDAVLIFERAGGLLTCVFTSGARATYFTNHDVALDDSTTAVAAAVARGHRVASRGIVRPALAGDRGFVAVPLLAAGTAFGVVYVASRTVDTLAGEAAIVALIDLAVPAYQLAQERERDREHASLDALTGLLTPRTLRARLVENCSEPRGQASNRLALLFIDTDNFKACNDSLGHAAGDIVLRSLAQLLERLAGCDAIVGRNGGDEFCVVLGGAGKVAAVRRAEEFRRRVESFDFSAVLDRGLTAPITASIGIAVFPTDADEPHRLLELADAAMYHSKRSGRNRVSYYDVGGAVLTYEPEMATTTSRRADG